MFFYSLDMQVNVIAMILFWQQHVIIGTTSAHRYLRLSNDNCCKNQSNHFSLTLIKCQRKPLKILKRWVIYSSLS